MPPKGIYRHNGSTETNSTLQESEDGTIKHLKWRLCNVKCE